MESKYRYFTVVDGYRREFFPYSVDQLQLTFNRSKDSLRYTHTMEYSDKISIRAADYTYVYGIETSSNRCGDILVEIQKWCNAAYVLFAEGSLRIISGEYDLDNCLISIAILANNPYTCYDYSKGKDIDIFEAVPFTQRIKVKAVEGQIETFESGATSILNPYDTSFGGGADPREKGWLAFKHEYWSDGNDNPRGAPVYSEWRHYYAREVITISCSLPDPLGWIKIEDNCPTNKKFARFPIRLNYRRIPIRFFNGAEGKTDFTGDSTIRGFPENEDLRPYQYDVMGLLDTPSDFDNGIKLSDILYYFIDKFCGIEVKSNFFQINADKTFTQAYPELPNDKRTLNNIMYQKSDVKRLNASNNATKGITTLEKLVNDICTTYNLQYRIENSFFNIEHVSYWEKTVELDLTTSEYARYMVGTNKYSYDDTKLPQFERFNMMEAGKPDFVGTPIEYFGRCIAITETDKNKLFSVGTITTDVEYCMENSSPDRESKVSDEGFVLMAAELKDSEFFLMRFNPILDDYPRANNPLSWAHLINAFYAHERPQKRGYVNNMMREFFTTAPVKKQNTFSIPLCCDDVLKITGLVKTKLGDGSIERAALNLSTDTVELDLMYTNPYQEFFCIAPVSFTLNRTTYNAFYFEISFLDCSEAKTVSLEVTFPDGAIENTTLENVACNAILEIPLTGVEGAKYKFRAKVICSDGESDWTPFLNVTYAAPVPCNPLPTVNYHSRPVTTTIVFRVNEIIDSVDAEITYPNNSVQVATNAMYRQNIGGGYTLIYVYLTTPFYSGNYKFRFRRRCDDGNTSLYGSYVNVSL